MLAATRDTLLGAGYRGIVKRIAFTQDPEATHDRISNFGRILGTTSIGRGLTSLMFNYQDPHLTTHIAGLPFRNPVGLSAGFDKEGRLLDILPSVGFGWIEIGSITGSPSAGNPKPRLWRLPKSTSLVVHFGLNSSGSAAVAERLRGRTWPIPVALSIAKANRPEFDSRDAGIADYVLAATNLRGIGAMRVINISCPNTTGGEPFCEPTALDELLQALQNMIHEYPTFVKLPADVGNNEIERIVDVCQRRNIAGFICTNLTRHREHVRDAVIPPKGGLSGKIVEARSNEVLALVARQTQGKMPIVGVGGIMSAADAYTKIKLGASLVSLITGMIYRGPMVVSEINRGVARLLQRDGFTSVSEAVGKDIHS